MILLWRPAIEMIDIDNELFDKTIQGSADKKFVSRRNRDESRFSKRQTPCLSCLQNWIASERRFVI